MRVYFTGSLHNEGIDTALYQKIAEYVRKMGHEVQGNVLHTTAHTLDTLTAIERAKYYRSLKTVIQANDLVIVEATYPSTINIGHEISLALDLGKPIVCLYQPGREPGVLMGIESEKLVLLEYSESDINAVLEYGLESAAEKMDVRFNFFVSPEISRYLEVISKDLRIPKAVYLRQLIEDAMAEDKEFSTGVK